MGVDTILWLIFWFIILAFLLINLSQVVFFIGLLLWVISSLFNVFQYIGVSCQLIYTFTAYFYTAIAFYIMFLIYKMFLHR